MAAFFAYFKLAGSSKDQQQGSKQDETVEIYQGLQRISLPTKLRKEFLGAAKSDNLEAVKHYLENGRVPIYCANANGQTAAHIAIENDRLPLLEYLLSKDIAALVGAEDRERRTPLHLAATLGRLEIVKFLVEVCKLPANLVNRTEMSVLYMTAARGEYQTVVYLLEHGADANVATFLDDTPLHVAARNGHLKIVQYLVDVGKANVKARNATGDTALHEAVKIKHADMVKYLVEECKASPLVENAEGENALYLALYVEDKRISDYLVQTCNLGWHRDIIGQFIDEIKSLQKKEATKAAKKRAKKEKKSKKKKDKKGEIDEKVYERPKETMLVVDKMVRDETDNDTTNAAEFTKHLRALQMMIENEKGGNRGGDDADDLNVAGPSGLHLTHTL